jgi:hypothetical protein
VGQVIGIVTIVGCKFSQVGSGWGMPGQYQWQLENPREITPIPYYLCKSFSHVKRLFEFITHHQFFDFPKIFMYG